MMGYISKWIVAAVFALQCSATNAFTISSSALSKIDPVSMTGSISSSSSSSSSSRLNWKQVSSEDEDVGSSCDRRGFLTSIATVATAATTTLVVPQAGWAAAAAAVEEQEGKEVVVDKTEVVRSALYYVMRVKEATQQETRLIKSGKFKDVQRANVKLAVRFMLENYKLSDNFIKASTFLTGTKKIAAVNAGQEVIQNLQTITEYFDSSDIQNIKVGNDSMGGKEYLVLNGLDATRKNIDIYLSYFDAADIAAVQSKIDAENELNEKEFDTALGSILNSAPKP